MPSRERRLAPCRVTSCPRKLTLPSDGGIVPASTLSSVVLPAPLGPTMPIASPGPTAKSTPSSAASAPNVLRTPAAARTGCGSIACPSSPASAVGLQLARHRDIVIVGVVDDDQREAEAAPLRRLAPLVADDRRGDDVADGVLRARRAPVERADRRLHLELLHRVRDGGLVVRVAARTQHRR